MIKQNLGKINNLRDVFKKKDKNFTPWLNEYVDTELIY